MNQSDVPEEWAIATIRARAELAASGRQYSLLDMHRHMIAAVEPLIAEKEREACAKEADGAGQGRAGTVIAAAIRARTSPARGDPV